MEPFDEALDRQIWSLAKTRLQWHKRTAEARRTIPSEIEANISSFMNSTRKSTQSAYHTLTKTWRNYPSMKKVCHFDFF
jgi:hypothetical protein